MSRVCSPRVLESLHWRMRRAPKLFKSCRRFASQLPYSCPSPFGLFRQSHGTNRPGLAERGPSFGSRRNSPGPWQQHQPHNFARIIEQPPLRTSGQLRAQFSDDLDRELQRKACPTQSAVCLPIIVARSPCKCPGCRSSFLSGSGSNLVNVALMWSTPMVRTRPMWAQVGPASTNPGPMLTEFGRSSATFRGRLRPMPAQFGPASTHLEAFFADFGSISATLRDHNRPNLARHRPNLPVSATVLGVDLDQVFPDVTRTSARLPP